MLRSLTRASDQQILDRWRVSSFWVLLIGYIGYYLCRANLSAAYPLLSQTFGYTNSQLGLIALYSEIAYAIGKFLNGPLGDRIGGRRVFLMGMAGAIFFNVLFSQFNSLFAFIVIWCFCRYFLSMGWGGIVKVVGAWYPPEKNGTIMGVISINFQFGGVVAALFAGFLVARGAGWRELFLYPAAVLSLIWVWSYLGLKESPSDVIPGAAATSVSIGGKKPIADFAEEKIDAISILKTLLKIKLFQQVLVFAFLTTFLRSIFMFWTPKYLTDIGMRDSTAIFSSAVFPLLGCVGTIFLGWYTDRYAKNGDRARMMWIMLVGLVLSLLAIALLSSKETLASNQMWIVILTGLSGFFLLGPYSMSAGCLTLDIAGAKGASTAAGWIDGVGYFGGSIAVWAAGALSDAMGWKEVFFVLAACAAMSALWAYWMSLGYQHAHADAKRTGPGSSQAGEPAN